MKRRVAQEQELGSLAAGYDKIVTALIILRNGDKRSLLFFFFVFSKFEHKIFSLKLFLILKLIQEFCMNER